MFKPWRLVVIAVLLAAVVAGFTLTARGAAPPPAIADLNGTTWAVTAKGTEYDLNGGKFPSSTSITWTVTQTGADTVSLDSVFGGMLFSSRYKGGFLLQSYASGENPPIWGSALQLVVSGSPGKMKMAGTLTVFNSQSGFENLRVLKVTAKQIAP